MPKLSKAEKQKLIEARWHVDAYTVAHARLHQKPAEEITLEAHALLRKKMLAELKKQGFDSLEEFLTAEAIKMEKL